MTKCHGHEVVRAPWNSSKSCTMKIEIDFVWSWVFKCSVKTYVTRLSIECYFITSLFMWTFVHNTLNPIKCCEISKCHDLLVLCPILLFELCSTHIQVDHGAISIASHVGFHISISSIQISLVPWYRRPSSSSVKWSETVLAFPWFKRF